MGLSACSTCTRYGSAPEIHLGMVDQWVVQVLLPSGYLDVPPRIGNLSFWMHRGIHLSMQDEIRIADSHVHRVAERKSYKTISHPHQISLSTGEWHLTCGKILDMGYEKVQKFPYHVLV